MRALALLRCGLAVALAGALALPLRAAGADDWKFDVLKLKNGFVLKGLLVDENADEVRFRNVRRSPGAPTVVIGTTAIPRGEIASIDKLTDKERELLAERLRTLDPSGKGEEMRMEALELKPAPWVRKGAGEALQYTSVHFVLLSNASEDTVRRAAVRLEQIYGAYTRFLPPRQKAGKPTTVVLVNSLAEYYSLLKDQGLNIRNPAFYESARNRVVCASDLQELGNKLEPIRKSHEQLLKKLDDQEQILRKQFGKKIPPDLLQRLNTQRQEIQQANKKNDGIFSKATRQLFQTLYHEAFHAYLANFVYSADEADVPRWLNEGLAQIFETALVEAGELRVGHVDKDRLAQLRDAVKKNALVPVVELLKSSPKEFLVAHASDQQVSDRYYLNSWALASYLTFDRGLLGTPALHKYVAARQRGTNEVEAFRALVGVPLAQFEKDYQKYLQNLRTDGTTKPR